MFFIGLKYRSFFYLPTLLLCCCWGSSISAQNIDYQLYTQGMGYKNAGEHQAAIHSFSSFLQRYPTAYPLAYQQRGALYYQLRQFERAADDFAERCLLEPDQADGHFALGQTYTQLQRYSEALQQLNTTIQINPSHAEAYNERGALYCRQRQFDAALEDFYKASELKPSFALACNNAGAARYFNQNVAKPTRKDLEIARDWFSKAIAADSSMVLALRNRAAMHLFLKAYPAAIADLQKARQLQPDDAMIHFYFGVAYADQEQYGLADQSFQQALQLQPQLSFAHEERGNLLKAQGRYAEAIASYQQAQQVQPPPSKLYIGLMDYRIALVAALQKQKSLVFDSLKKAQRQKVFRDMRVYRDLLKAKELNTFRSSKKFKKLVKALRKGKKDNKFLHPGLGWFRMRK